MSTQLPKAQSATPVLTPAQKAKVRDALDTFYDDEACLYRAGKTDQIIGDELGVPYDAVATMRESAYGPIKSDPEVEALSRQLEYLRGSIKTIEGRVESLMTDLDAATKGVSSLATKLDALLRKRRA